MSEIAKREGVIEINIEQRQSQRGNPHSRYEEYETKIGGNLLIAPNGSSFLDEFDGKRVRITIEEIEEARKVES